MLLTLLLGLGGCGSAQTARAGRSPHPLAVSAPASEAQVNQQEGEEAAQRSEEEREHTKQAREDREEEALYQREEARGAARHSRGRRHDTALGDRHGPLIPAPS